jgi:hypothetical protein
VIPPDPDREKTPVGVGAADGETTAEGGDGQIDEPGGALDTPQLEEPPPPEDE